METITSADGTVIAYDRSGEGPPVVLVGGGFATRSDPILAAVAQALAPSFTVINYDRRGRGDSGNTMPYAAKREIEDLVAIIDHVGPPALVFGGSSGGCLALEAAAAGAAITKLAVFEPPYVTDADRPPLPSEQELTALVEAGRRGDAVELFMTRGADVPAEMLDAMKTSPYWEGMEALAHTLAYEAAVVGPGPIPTGRLATIGVPTLVLVGTESAPRMRDAAAAVSDAVPGATLRRLEGQAHGQLDPVRLAAELTAFF